MDAMMEVVKLLGDCFLHGFHKALKEREEREGEGIKCFVNSTFALPCTFSLAQNFEFHCQCRCL